MEALFKHTGLVQCLHSLAPWAQVAPPFSQGKIRRLMSSRLENALMLLGLESADDPATLWQNYTDRLAVLQHKLINAETMEAQEAAQQDLARLVAAYQMARSATEPATRQVNRSSMVNREAVTMMR